MALLLVLLLFLVSHLVALVGSVNDEGLALLSFKQAIANFPEGYLNNWNSSDENPCSWERVACRHGKVLSLAIPNKELSGYIPAELGNLSAISHINLRNNNLSGCLPADLFNASKLQSLVLSGNSFSGAVPSQIGNLKYLQVLDLSHNSFSGPIPSSLAQCKRLKMLLLNQNSFTGFLPDGFGTNLSTLQTLDLSFNNLSGLIPNDIGNLSSLTGVLALSHNLFNGPVPASLESLAERVYIDLSNNNLSGLIPQTTAIQSLGPTAFIGNPSLCGLPLKVTCPLGNSNHSYDKPLPYNPPHNSGKVHHSIAFKVAITLAVALALGTCIAGFLFYYRRKKASGCLWDANVGGRRLEEKLTINKELFCFARNDLETLSENLDQYEFVPLDLQVDFDLEQLLKASAFLLGKSTIGIVYRVVLNSGVAVAVRRLGRGGWQRFKEFQTEVDVIGKIRHPNIVSLRAYFWSIDEKLLIYDYIRNGDLGTAIHGKAGIISHKPLLWPARLRIIKGMAKGLAFLHEFSSRRYIHGDLRPSNILLAENLEPHISDFGLGRLANIAEETLEVQWEQSTTGTPRQSSPYEFTTINSTISRSYYQAPEASKGRKPTQKWDVYSFGVILLEIISGKLPMLQIGSLEMELVQWIQRILEDGKPITEVLDPFLACDLDKQDEIISVLKISFDCTCRNPDKRPSMRQVCDSLNRVTGSHQQLQQFVAGE